jgi:magnesium transporter
MDKYDLYALPVVDEESRLVGIVTIDDAVDVLREEATEDIEKMAAITPGENALLKNQRPSDLHGANSLAFAVMISATFTGMINTSFESALAAQVALTAFIPMLMDTGGNSGSQASVTVIRGLSLGEIGFSDYLRVLWKEARVSVLCAVALAAVGFAKMLLIDRVSVTIAAVVCITLALTVVCAKCVGCSLPMLAKRIGFDPAVMASPFITTIVDAFSLVIYFTVATALLHL